MEAALPLILVCLCRRLVSMVKEVITDQTDLQEKVFEHVILQERRQEVKCSYDLFGSEQRCVKIQAGSARLQRDHAFPHHPSTRGDLCEVL